MDPGVRAPRHVTTGWTQPCRRLRSMEATPARGTTVRSNGQTHRVIPGQMSGRARRKVDRAAAMKAAHADRRCRVPGRPR